MRDPFHDEILAAVPKLRRFAFRLSGGAQDGEDLTQHCIERALKYRDSYILGSNMSAFLCKIAYNQFLSEKRKSGRFFQLFDGAEDLLRLEPNADLRLEVQDTFAAIGRLPVTAQQALHLALDGLEYVEIADRLDVAVGTAKSRVSRARTQLREALA